jgi:hypothetical protein
MLFVGSVGGALSMFAIGAYIAIAQPTKPENVSDKLSSGGIVAMFFFYLWTVFYSPTWNGTVSKLVMEVTAVLTAESQPWVFGAEVFPTYIRVGTQSFVAASNWLFAFLIARFTPQMFKAMGYGVYLFFASLMVLSIFFVFVSCRCSHYSSFADLAVSFPVLRSRDGWRQPRADGRIVRSGSQAMEGSRCHHQSSATKPRKRKPS